MRRLFPLKPVSASNSNNNSSCNLPKSKADRDGPYFWGSAVDNGGDNVKENSLEAQMKRDHLYVTRKHMPSRGDLNLSPPKADVCSKPDQRFDSPVHRRSYSSSSSIFSNNSAERNPSSLSDLSKSSISSTDVFVQGIQCTPLAARPNADDGNRGVKTHSMKRPISVPKDRPEANISRVVDLRLAGSEGKMIPSKVPSKIAVENEVVVSSGRPPRFRSSGQVPTVSARELVRSRSFSEAKDAYACHENVGDATSLKLHSGGRVSSENSAAGKFSFSARNVAERLARSLPGKSRSKSNNFDKKTSSKDNIVHGEGQVCSEFIESIPVSGSEVSFCTEESSPSRHLENSLPGGHERSPNEQKWFPVNQTGCGRGAALYRKQKEPSRERFWMWLEGGDNTADTDEELEKRAEAAEEQARLVSNELTKLSCYHYGITEAVGAKEKGSNTELLQQRLREVCEEKINMALQIASHIRKRVMERSAANESLKLLMGVMESREKMIENEKNDLQLTLEKELDRRSNEWATKLEKIRSEEKKLKDRMRDLAEQNVALQREISILNSREISSKNEVRQSQLYVDGFRRRLEEAENEVIHLRQSLTDTCKKAKETESDRDSVKRNYKEKERENYDLQKSVVRLQRLCKDQERTISGLREGLNNEVNDRSHDMSNHITKLQQEQLRLTGVEQSLRKDLESCKCEVDGLRHENTNLLARVQDWENGTGFGLIKLDQELQGQLDVLRSQALSLLDEYNLLSSKLLEFIKSKFYAVDRLGMNVGGCSENGLGSEQERNNVLELEMNVQRLRKKVDSVKKSARVLKIILKEKSLMTCDESVPQNADSVESWKPELQSSEVKEQLSELQQELKAETLLAKLLRDRLCSREVELEQLHAEVALLISSQEGLKNENVRLHDMLNIANHKEKDLELRLGGKDGRICHLQADLQECLKELTFLREELPKVSEERSIIQQQAEQLGWQNVRLSAEVETLKRKIEKLDEDVLLKEGQLTILQESLEET